MNNSIRYCIADEFTKYPGGRLRKHGPKSGQEFREDVLLPLLEKYDEVTIDLTNAVGYGSSFLDEAFGEIGKIKGLPFLEKKLKIVATDDPFLADLVWDKIKKGSEEYQG